MQAVREYVQNLPIRIIEINWRAQKKGRIQTQKEMYKDCILISHDQTCIKHPIIKDNTEKNTTSSHW